LSFTWEGGGRSRAQRAIRPTGWEALEAEGVEEHCHMAQKLDLKKLGYTGSPAL
jgi:hypothetical protein